MDANKRRDQIVNILHEKKHQSVNEIIAAFDVAPATIRRDLRHLEKIGLIIKSHGAVQIAESVSVPKYLYRQEKYSDEKLAIAKAALCATDGATSLILDSGTSVQAFATQLLKSEQRLTVITNSLSLPAVLVPDHITVIYVAE